MKHTVSGLAKNQSPLIDYIQIYAIIEIQLGHTIHFEGFENNKRFIFDEASI